MLKYFSEISTTPSPACGRQARSSAPSVQTHSCHPFCRGGQAPSKRGFFEVFNSRTLYSLFTIHYSLFTIHYFISQKPNSAARGGC